MTLRLKRQVLLPAVLVLVFGLVVETVLERRYLNSLRAEQLEEMSMRLGAYRYQLESMLSNNLSLINGLSAFISSNPNYSQEQFDSYAATVLAREPSLVNMAAAKDLIISHIYPLTGNEQALGLNYNLSPEQLGPVLRVIASGEMVVAGPVALVQGGSAFIGRAAVYVDDPVTGDERVWGIVSAPIRTEDVYRESGLLEPLPLRLAIRGEDGSGADGQVFFGDAEVFSHRGHLRVPVSVGGGEWEMAAAPLQDVSAANSMGTVFLRIAIGLLTLFLLLAILLTRRQIEQDKAYKKIIFRNERFLREVEAVSQVGGWRLNSRGIFTEVSTQARQILSLPEDKQKLTIEEFCSVLDSGSASELKQQFLEALSGHQELDREIRLRRSNGEIIWLHLKGDVIDNGNGFFEIIGAVQDITQAKFADSLIEYQANYDALTGLPNRGLFQDRLHTALVQSRRNSMRLAVLFIDLDNFKSVNDNLGHDAGDMLLVKVAERISGCLRESDTVARYSGDEFIVILGSLLTSSTVSRVAADIVTAMSSAFQIDANQVYCGVSIGVAFYPEDGDDVETLTTKADQAMYQVKKSGRNGWQFYTGQMQIESEQKHRLYNDLVEAMNCSELQVFYQPLVDGSNMRVVGCEALVRWQREDGSWISPDEFIPVAEERGLINRLDYYVLTQAAADMTELNRETGLQLGLSVNVSSRLLHLRDEHSRNWLADIKTMKAFPVTVEITERILIDDSLDVGNVLEDLHSHGICICIDDFGTGYSGLSYFSRFPVTQMKIDRSFTGQIGKSPTQEALIESMLLMAGKLKVKVVAEGVETEEQVSFLQALKCQYLQGYHLARPMPLEQLKTFIESGNQTK